MDDTMATGTLLLSLTIPVVLACGCSRGTRDDFQRIRGLVCAGKYEEAVPLLEDYEGKHASRAGLFLGKAHLALGDLDAARAAFEHTAEKYPQSLEAHKCRFKLAVVAYLAGDRAEAKERFGALARLPDGPLAPEATAFLRHLE